MKTKGERSAPQKSKLASKSKRAVSAPKPKRARPPKSPDPMMQAFFAEVKRHRLGAGMSLEEMAERAKLTPNYIGTIENGYRDPSLSTLESLAMSLAVPLAELFGLQRRLTASSMEMATLFDDSAAELQVALLKFLHAIAKNQRRQSQRPDDE